MSVSGTIRNDASGKPYLSEKPSDNVIHIAYQDFTIDDIGEPYEVLYATEEKHMVSGINKLFKTRYTWDDLVGKTVEFFVSGSEHPFVNLMFEKIGANYTAKVIAEETTWSNSEKTAGDIYTTLEEALLTDNVVYHGKDSDGTAAELLKFTRLSYTTHAMSSKPTLETDFTLLLVGKDKLVTTKLNTYPFGVSDTHTVLEFDKEYIPVIELKVDADNVTRGMLAKAIAHETGLTVTPDNFVSNDVIRVFDPSTANYANEVLTLYTLHSGDSVKFVLGGWEAE